MVRVRSCGILVFRRRPRAPREYLLLHYLSGHWDFPKGHVEKGESEIETALRELEEETGIRSVDFVEGFRHVIHYKYRSKREGFVEKEVVYFAGRADADRIQISNEHKGYQWLPVSAALKAVKFANARKLLRGAEDHMKRRERLAAPRAP